MAKMQQSSNVIMAENFSEQKKSMNGAVGESGQLKLPL